MERQERVTFPGYFLLRCFGEQNNDLAHNCVTEPFKSISLRPLEASASCAGDQPGSKPRTARWPCAEYIGREKQKQERAIRLARCKSQHSAGGIYRGILVSPEPGEKLAQRCCELPWRYLSGRCSKIGVNYPFLRKLFRLSLRKIRWLGERDTGRKD
jgi:hypothetical protein